MTIEQKSKGILFQSARDTAFAGLLGVALFTINFLPGTFLTALGGGTPLAALVGGITTPFFLVTSGVRIRRVGAISLTYLVYATLAIPFLLFGPPHPYKPLMAILSTLLFELVVWLGRYRKVAFYLGIVVFSISSLVVYIAAFKILGLPGVERMLDAVYVFAALFVALALFSTWLALLVNKIRSSAEEGE